MRKIKEQEGLKRADIKLFEGRLERFVEAWTDKAHKTFLTSIGKPLSYFCRERNPAFGKRKGKFFLQQENNYGLQEVFLEKILYEMYMIKTE